MAACCVLAGYETRGSFGRAMSEREIFYRNISSLLCTVGSTTCWGPLQEVHRCYTTLSTDPMLCVKEEESIPSVCKKGILLIRVYRLWVRAN
eukprot:851325-Amorphochlora_amoeboformis.AAC.1